MDLSDFAWGQQFQPSVAAVSSAALGFGQIEADVPWMGETVITVD